MEDSNKEQKSIYYNRSVMLKTLTARGYSFSTKNKIGKVFRTLQTEEEKEKLAQKVTELSAKVSEDQITEYL